MGIEVAWKQIEVMRTALHQKAVDEFWRHWLAHSRRQWDEAATSEVLDWEYQMLERTAEQLGLSLDDNPFVASHLSYLKH